MSRRRQFDQPPIAHAYWVHSDPEPTHPAPPVPCHGTAAQDACPGPCNRDFRAAEQTYAETRKEHDVPFHPGAPVWCRDTTGHHGCTERITADLAALPDLATLLTPGPLNRPRDANSDDRGMGTSTLVHPPTASPGWDTADDLIRWSVALEDQLRTRLGHDSRQHETWRDLGSAVRYLTAYATALLSDPDTSAVIGRQITGRRRALDQATGTARLVHRLPGMCPSCDRRGRLHRQDGADHVKCGSCQAVWDMDHWAHLTRAAVAAERIHSRRAG